MLHLNRQVVGGNIGKDPTLNHTQKGDPVTNFTVAYTKSWPRMKEGQPVLDDKGKQVFDKETTWFKVTAWRGLAKFVMENCKKGTNVYVEGPTKMKPYVDQKGQHRMDHFIEATCIQTGEKRMTQADADQAAASSYQSEISSDHFPQESDSYSQGDFSDEQIPF